MYTITVNMPGYMPEVEANHCDTLSEAWEVLNDEVSATLGALDEEDPERGNGLPLYDDTNADMALKMDRQFIHRAGNYVHTLSLSRWSHGVRLGEEVLAVNNNDDWALNVTRAEYRCNECIPPQATVDPEDPIALHMALEVGEEADYWQTHDSLDAQGVDMSVDTPQHCSMCDTLIVLPLTEAGKAYVRERVAERVGRGVILDSWQEGYPDLFHQCEKCDEAFPTKEDLDEHMAEQHWSIKTWQEASVAYNEMLDETYPSVNFGNVTIYPSEMLKTDETAYDEGIDAWIESQGIDVNILRGL